jgi:cysteine desulfurase
MKAEDKNKKIVYLDNSATTRQYDEVTEAMYKLAKENYGNPSSLHSMGLAAEKAVRQARGSLAKALGAAEDEVYFTSCGTESDNTVLMGAARAKRRTGKKIIVSAVEHPAILEPAKRLEEMGYEVEYIGVDGKCELNLEQLKAAITDETILISVMGVNNETGTIMPIPEIARIKDEYNKAHGTDIWLHSDCVQAFGKIPMSLTGEYRGVDFVSLSAHKIHGPKGMGGLYVRKGRNLPAFMLGGGQEKHMRSGTENTPGIIGFGKAAELASANFGKRIENMRAARAYLLEAIKSEIGDIRINSPEDESACPSVLNVSFLGTRGEVILHTLEQDGIFVSTGSACASNHASQKGSHVLNAMGLSPKEIEGAIRFSFSEFSTIEDMEYAATKVKAAVQRFRRLGSYR